ncbi:glycine receptor subunit alpha-4-like [Ptychodera flava]|uniref:glycine receptor subunit alpha-4-like n=1 Tax=Ptychodera flava TaxID=63121 RepID=UPI00396A2263
MQLVPDIVCIIVICFTAALCENPGNESLVEQTVIIDSLMETYDKRTRPNANGRNVKVYVDMFITSFDSIRETTMDYAVTMYFRQHWYDERLQYNDTETIVVTDNIRERFWVPDLFFVNVKSAHFHTVTKDNVFFRIHSDGLILYSVRLSLTLACHMSLEEFPMDKQICGIQIEPYGYTTKDLELAWYPENAVRWDKDLKLAQYTLEDEIQMETAIQDYTTGYFGHVNVQFTLTRQLGFYILQTYIPSVLLVVLSWVSFWIDVAAAPARVALGITTVLTLTTQGSGVRSELPKVAYAKAIDIWMAACLVFVFSALVEFALVNYLNALGNDRQNLSKFFRDQERDKDLESRESTSRETDPTSTNWITKTSSMSDVDCEEKIPRSPGTYVRQHSSTRRSRSGSYKFATALAYQRTPDGNLADTLYGEGLKLKNKALGIDRLSRLIFPLFFAIFNCIYWPMYMIGR